MGRSGAPAVNVLHPEKARRIDAMDEIKRALEVADQIPFSTLCCISASAMTVGRSALSSLPSTPSNISAHSPSPRRAPAGGESDQRATTPEHLITILDLGHLNNVGMCLDLGHAHIERASPRLSKPSEAASPPFMSTTITA